MRKCSFNIYTFNKGNLLEIFSVQSMRNVEIGRQGILRRRSNRTNRSQRTSMLDVHFRLGAEDLNVLRAMGRKVPDSPRAEDRVLILR